MPTYSYFCKSCSQEISVDKAMKDAGREEKCPDCGETLERRFSTSAFKLAGAGFHCNDYN